jgi:hypothetical protein
LDNGPPYFVLALVGEWAQEGRQQVAVGAVQFEQVKTGDGCTPGGGSELIDHLIHVGASHGAWNLINGPPTAGQRLPAVARHVL